MLSHPSWVRGLKLIINHVFQSKLTSHPSWVRGLKLLDGIDVYKHLKVAPLVGAWIETDTSCENLALNSSHPSWVRGLKPTLLDILISIVSRTPRGCVD